jgi:hypothetical protein
MLAYCRWLLVADVFIVIGSFSHDDFTVFYIVPTAVLLYLSMLDIFIIATCFHTLFIAVRPSFVNTENIHIHNGLNQYKVPSVVSVL